MLSEWMIAVYTFIFVIKWYKIYYKWRKTLYLYSFRGIFSGSLRLNRTCLKHVQIARTVTERLGGACSLSLHRANYPAP